MRARTRRRAIPQPASQPPAAPQVEWLQGAAALHVRVTLGAARGAPAAAPPPWWAVSFPTAPGAPARAACAGALANCPLAAAGPCNSVAAPELAAPGGRAAAAPAGSVAVQSMGGCAAGAAAPEQAAGAPLLYGLKARSAEPKGLQGVHWLRSPLRGALGQQAHVVDVVCSSE